MMETVAAARQVAAEATRVAASLKAKELQDEARRVRAALAVIGRERVPLPIELKAGRDRVSQLARRLRKATEAHERAITQAKNLERNRPQGWRRLVAWSTGSSRRYEEALRTAQAAAEAAEQHQRAQNYIAESAKARQALKEVAWRQEIMTAQAQRQKVLDVRGAWLVDAITVLERRPDLGSKSEAELAEAVERSRIVRKKLSFIPPLSPRPTL